MNDMREIKFRAWDKIQNRYWTQKEMTEIGGFYYTFGVLPDSENFDLQQFTGLKDKNGKEIYEGDIVKVPFHDGIQEYNSEIKWNGTGWTINDHGSNKNAEIIGNIYENENLLNDNE